MADDPDDERDDDFRDMLRDFLSGNSSFDPAQLAGAAGLPNDPASIAQLLNQLQRALQGAGDGINWETTAEQAKHLAADGAVEVTPAERASYDQVFNVAALWLDAVATVAELTERPQLMGRVEWTRQTVPLWSQLAEPVALSISDALTRVLKEQAPEEMQGMIAGAGQLMRQVGGALFAMQLGQVVGQLAREVVSGGDIGIPLLKDGHAALLPQNVGVFGDGLDIPADQVQIYLAVRELAHARLFRHAKWLRLQMISAISEFARGITIDTDRLEELAEGFDPSNPEELRQAVVSGALIPEKTEAQAQALSRLETVLALVEGWVDVVTAAATARLPKSDAIAETVRRRRAVGGPAESALATLVGLELRPRRLRDAAAMWQRVTDAVGPEARDALWSHPDLLPTAEDLDDPAALIERLTAEASGTPRELDEVDQALEELLRGEGGAADGHGTAGES